MKILSKYKDYYDYLSGIYGEDPKIILDRREFDQCIISSTLCHPVSLHIAGMVYDGFNYLGDLYWGEQLREISSKKPTASWYYDDLSKRDNGDYILIVDKSSYRYEKDYLLCTTPYIDKNNLNKKYNCPILLNLGGYKKIDDNKIHKYPKLIDLGFNKVVDAQTIYLSLSEWLAPKDNIENKQTDKEKIISAGFDLRTSFRH